MFNFKSYLISILCLCILIVIYILFCIFCFCVVLYIVYVCVVLWIVCVFVLFYVFFVCKCVLYYCHRVLTQLQLTNISYLIISHCMYITKYVFENQKFANHKDVLQRGILLSTRVFRKFKFLRWLNKNKILHCLWDDETGVRNYDLLL